MKKKETTAHGTYADQASRPDTPPDKEARPGRPREVKVECEERTPEEAGYGFGV